MLQVAPDGAFTENDRKRLSLGPLSRDRGPLGRWEWEMGGLRWGGACLSPLANAECVCRAVLGSK